MFLKVTIELTIEAANVSDASKALDPIRVALAGHGITVNDWRERVVNKKREKAQPA